VLRRHPDLIHGFASMLGVGGRCREATAEAAGALRLGLGLAKARQASRSTQAGGSETG
jgi:acetyl esterase